MNVLEPDALADRIEREIRDGAFILLGPAGVALCVEALRDLAAERGQPNPSGEAVGKLSWPTLRSPDTDGPMHPRLVDILEAYGCHGSVVPEADE